MLEAFISDLVTLIQEHYNRTLRPLPGETEQAQQFRLGENTAFYSVLSLIELQLNAFDLKISSGKPIAPEPGKPVDS